MNSTIQPFTDMPAFTPTLGLPLPDFDYQRLAGRALHFYRPANAACFIGPLLVEERGTVEAVEEGEDGSVTLWIRADYDSKLYAVPFVAVQVG